MASGWQDIADDGMRGWQVDLSRYGGASSERGFKHIPQGQGDDFIEFLCLAHRFFSTSCFVFVESTQQTPCERAIS
jgi:hypothetical protein